MFQCLETLWAAASRKKRPQSLELALELGHPSKLCVTHSSCRIQMLVEHLTPKVVRGWGCAAGAWKRANAWDLGVPTWGKAVFVEGK